MKKRIKYFILALFLIPLIVNANIQCNDGTESSSCIDCHRGCCSGHLGCAEDKNGNDIDYEEETSSTKPKNSLGYMDTDGNVFHIEDSKKKDNKVNSIATSIKDTNNEYLLYSIGAFGLGAGYILGRKKQ